MLLDQSVSFHHEERQESDPTRAFGNAYLENVRSSRCTGSEQKNGNQDGKASHESLIGRV
jgi:hypothetical protein